MGKALFGATTTGGYDSPEEIEDKFELPDAERIRTEHPTAVAKAADQLTELSSGTQALLEYFTHFQPLEHGEHTLRVGEAIAAAGLQAEARTMVGELHVAYASLRRLAIRHPEVAPSPL